MIDVAIDVAIIGAGPVGVLLANLLGQLGHAVTLIERETGVHPLPRAAHFDGEVMRAFQAAGLADEVAQVARPGNQGMKFVNARGQLLLERQAAPGVGPNGFAGNYYFHQPKLEAVLREGLQRYANVRLLTGHDVLALHDDADHIRLEVRASAVSSVASSEVPHKSFTARYVVGCDGARSLVRRHIGGENEDLGLHQPWLVVDVLLKEGRSAAGLGAAGLGAEGLGADGLDAAVAARMRALPEHTVQHCDPARPRTYVNMIGARRRWEIMLLPGEDPTLVTQPEYVWRLLAPQLLPDDADIERAVVYTFHSLIAQRWLRGRALIAGDAAHQTPPFLGQGLCAGVRDVMNLSWKLDRVLRGESLPALLESYQSERVPNVRNFIELAVRLGAIIQTTDPQIAAQRDQQFARSPEVFSFPPPKLGPGVWDSDNKYAGQLFVQPQFADGHRLDDLLGPGFVLLLRSDSWALDSLVCSGPAARLISSQLRAEPGDWLDALAHDWQVSAIVLRPDRMVYSTARNAQELTATLSRLAVLCRNVH